MEKKFIGLNNQQTPHSFNIVNFFIYKNLHTLLTHIKTFFLIRINRNQLSTHINKLVIFFWKEKFLFLQCVPKWYPLRGLRKVSKIFSKRIFDSKRKNDSQSNTKKLSFSTTTCLIKQLARNIFSFNLKIKI